MKLLIFGKQSLITIFSFRQFLGHTLIPQLIFYFNVDTERALPPIQIVSLLPFDSTNTGTISLIFLWLSSNHHNAFTFDDYFSTVNIPWLWYYFYKQSYTKPVPMIFSNLLIILSTTNPSLAHLFSIKRLKRMSLYMPVIRRWMLMCFTCADCASHWFDLRWLILLISSCLLLPRDLEKDDDDKGCHLLIGTSKSTLTNRCVITWAKESNEYKLTI